jgi:DNA repair exonuclease SbcCD nuclease subunit
MHFLGDIHGDFYCIEKFCRKNGEKKKINLIQIGDFGAGFDFGVPGEFIIKMDYLNSILAEYNITLYVLRGNHDDPQYFTGTYENYWSNLKLMPDYSVLEIEGKRVLLVGGAISIDRLGRTEGVSWWPDEVFVLDEEKLKMIKNIDLVATHTSPKFCHPTEFNNLVFSFAGYDPTLLSELTSERELITRMYHILKENGNPMEKWFYGHFHAEKHKTYDDTQFNLLSINQYYEYGAEPDGE